jgi:hypothetical protein
MVLFRAIWNERLNVTSRYSPKEMYMLSGWELTDTENISLSGQNMKFVGE